MHSIDYRYLRFANFKNILQWDLKRYLNKTFKSKYDIVDLGTHIKEESKKYAICEEGKLYGILGVNNQTGIFDAYLEDGSRIKQKYKRMETGWIAYNPYRVNVGSIGIKKPEHKNEYISPAYVVFSCKEGLSPDFLYLLMKTNFFNKIIKENTTGSVRQNLKYSVLSNLQIPLPTFELQNKIVAAYNTTIAQADQYAQSAKNIDAQIESYLQEILGLKQTSSTQKQNTIGRFFKLVRLMDITRWDVYNNRATCFGRYNSVYLSEIINKISTGTTPPTYNKEYFNGDIDFYTPSDINGDMYLRNAERHIAQCAIDDKKARLFYKRDLLFVGIGSTVGKVGLVAKDIVSSNQQITGITFNTNRIIPEYAFVYMHYFKEKTTADQSKTTLPIVNQEKIGQIRIPLPPIDTQNNIVNHINKLKEQIIQLKQQAEDLRKKALEEFEKEIFE